MSDATQREPGALKKQRKTLQLVTDAIASDLAQQLRNPGQQSTQAWSDHEEMSSQRLLDLILPRLSVAVASCLGASFLPADPSSLEQRVQLVERELTKLLSGGDADQNQRDASAQGSALPNLKYAKPKYKTVDSMLKYIEGQEETSGIKLVIMNFND